MAAPGTGLTARPAARETLEGTFQLAKEKALARKVWFGVSLWVRKGPTPTEE